jgi:hypothetical protein
MAWMCGEHHLPKAGGIEDQDYKQIRLMRASENIYRVMDRMRNLQGAQIHSLTATERKLIKGLREGGYIG